MTHAFMLLLDDAASQMAEALVASGMSERFPECSFRIQRTRNPEFADMVLPIASTKSNCDELGSFSVHPPPDDLADSVCEAFNNMLREAWEAKPS